MAGSGYLGLLTGTRGRHAMAQGTQAKTGLGAKSRGSLIRFGSTIITNGRRPWHAPKFDLMPVWLTEAGKTSASGDGGGGKHS